MAAPLETDALSSRLFSHCGRRAEVIIVLMISVISIDDIISIGKMLFYLLKKSLWKLKIG